MWIFHIGQLRVKIPFSANVTNFRQVYYNTGKISKITRYNSRVIMVITTAVKSKRVFHNFHGMLFLLFFVANFCNYEFGMNAFV